MIIIKKGIKIIDIKLIKICISIKNSYVKHAKKVNALIFQKVKRVNNQRFDVRRVMYMLGKIIYIYLIILLARSTHALKINHMVLAYFYYSYFILLVRKII